MNQPVDPESLRGIRFLVGLSETQLEQLANVSRFVSFSAGEVIFREGDPTDHVLLVATGSVALELCAPAIGCHRILTAGAGELLGWSAVLEQASLTASARTLEPVTAVRIPSVDLLALCRDDCQLGFEIMRRTALTLAKRLRASRLQLTDMYSTQRAAATQADEEQT